MPDEPNAIAPALTAEEWKEPSAWGVVEAVAAGDELVVDGPIEIPDHVRAAYLSDAPRTLFVLMAKANAALPDNDPRKITREDVSLLCRMGAELDEHYLSGRRGLYPGGRQLSMLVLRLKALLPPKG